MSTDPNELARNLRNKLLDKDDGTVNPMEGRIVTGIATSRDMSVRANTVRADRPPLTPLEALFSPEDPEGCKYYMSPTGIMNTPRKDGTMIEFVRGVYKTANPEDIELLEYLIKQDMIREVIPPEAEAKADKK